jgi:hypothetical protein
MPSCGGKSGCTNGDTVSATVYVPHVRDERRSEIGVLHELVCLECGALSGELAVGWQAYIYEGELLVYCAACARREFLEDGDRD